MTWKATVLTLFPEMFPGPLGFSLAGRALGTLWSLENWPRTCENCIECWVGP